jgi:hypothetical protein
MFIPVSDWFAAFVLTLAVEVPVAAVALRTAEASVTRLVVLIVFVNLATHLAVWYVFSQLFLIGKLEYTLAAEGWAIGAEAVFYKAALPRTSWRRVLAAAVVANGASTLAGRLELWPILQSSG